MSWCLFRVLAMAFPGLVSWGKAPLLGPFTVSALVGRVPLDKQNRVPLMILSSPLEDLDSDQQAQLVATPGSHELPPEAGASLGSEKNRTSRGGFFLRVWAS